MAYNTEVIFTLTYQIKKLVRTFKSGAHLVQIKCISSQGYSKNNRGLPKEIEAMGYFPVLNVGDICKSQAQFEEYQGYGYRIHLLDVPEIILPSTEEELIKYIKRQKIRGVGEESAKKIVNTLGISAITKINEDPEIIDEVPGMTAKQKAAFTKWCHDNIYYEELVLFLQQMDIPISAAAEIYKSYGNVAIARIHDDPYSAYSAGVISFRMADKIAKKLNVPWNDEVRFKCAVRAAIDYRMYSHGDVCIPRKDIQKIASEYLERSAFYPKIDDDSEESLSQTARMFEPKDYEDVITAMIANGELIEITKNKEKYIYRRDAYQYEKDSANMTAAMLLRDPVFSAKGDFIKDFLKADTKEISDEQMLAVRRALENGISILTGGPGTGKTWTVRAIVKCIKRFRPELNMILLAPTAKAAARLREITGIDANTIHSALRLNAFGNGSYETDYKMDADVVIVDEASMIDSSLYYNLLKRMKESSVLILTGDSAQLPSVGYGDVLNQLIVSGCVPVTELTKIYRQAEGSSIIQNAHKIRSGDPKEIRSIKYGKDFMFLTGPRQWNGRGMRFKDEESEVAEGILWIVSKLVDRGVPLEDIMVLTPVHATEVGTDALNIELQNMINPNDSGTIPALHVNDMKEFRKGDRVLHTKNNKDLGVRNGDIGTVIEIDGEASLTVEYDNIEEPVVYRREDMDELELAYSMTVHKSQGSEAEYVIMPFVHLRQHLFMLSNNLIYTALTRTKKQFVGVGDIEVLKERSLKRDADERVSLLAPMLRDATSKQ